MGRRQEEVEVGRRQEEVEVGREARGGGDGRWEGTRRGE